MRCLLLALVMLGTALPTSAAPMRCDITKKFACNPGGCRETKGTIWNLVDFKAQRFSRCDKKGCDHYTISRSESGIYVNITVPDRAMFAKMSRDGSEYVEVVSLGTNVLVSYGSCK